MTDNEEIERSVPAETDDIINSIPIIDNNTKKIASQILTENDVNKVKDLTYLFNLNQRKKNVIRLMKFNDLLDSVSDNMYTRLSTEADGFSNKDLVQYMQVVQDAIDRTQKSIDLVSEEPAIQINTQNNLNINVDDGFDRESRERIASAVKAILEKAKQQSTSNSNVLKEEDNE